MVQINASVFLALSSISSEKSKSRNTSEAQSDGGRPHIQVNTEQVYDIFCPLQQQF